MHMETAITKIKEAISNEQEGAVRIGLKRALYILQDEYIRSLPPAKAIETINQYKKEL